MVDGLLCGVHLAADQGEGGGKVKLRDKKKAGLD